MTQLHVEQCEITYEGAFMKPALSLVDSPGKLCDLLLDALEAFGCTSADLLSKKASLASGVSRVRSSTRWTHE